MTGYRADLLGRRLALSASHGHGMRSASNRQKSRRLVECDTGTRADCAGEDNEMICADDVRIACPLFQAESGGEVPTSALQLRLYRCSLQTFSNLTNLWHSRLPDIGGFYINGLFFTAEFSNLYYATAGWSSPISMSFNGTQTLELRRFAIAPDAPKNTASRLLSVMIRIIKRQNPTLVKLISYQDTGVHSGIIYKAQGWQPTRISKEGEQNWVKTKGTSCKLQTTTAKIRWELDIQ